ncbi:Mitochondrial acidic protein mam33 [Umbelopsis sp. WA50703]
MDEELSYQNVEAFADIEAPILESLSKHQFELQDKEGAEEVMLTKQTDKEEIKIIFSLSSILEESADLDDVITAEDGDKKTEDADMDSASALSLALRVAITKKEKGTMAFDLIAKEDDVSLINIEYSQDLSFLLPESAYQSRRGSRRYLGPNCLALDMSLQQSFQSYLTNTGVNQDVIKLIVEYAQLKRKKEYAAWLKNVGNFTDN